MAPQKCTFSNTFFKTLASTQTKIELTLFFKKKFQMLLLGLLLCCGSAVVYTLKPTTIVCSLSRIAAGSSYAVLYSTFLVKLVFLVSLNGGVYLPATYQSLLLCFAILIQLVIGVQWLVSDPADVVMKSAAIKETITLISNNATTVAPSLNITQESLG